MIIPTQNSTADKRKEIKILPFRVACGEFISTADVEPQDLEKPGSALLPQGFSYVGGMFAVRALGTSMWPRVNDGYWCIFEPYRGGTRQDRLVLVEDRSKNRGDRYTLKKFRSKKIQSEDGSWRHEEIELLPLNSGEHPPIRLFENCNYEIRGWFVGAVKELDRVDPFLFRNVSNDVGRASVDFEGYW